MFLVKPGEQSRSCLRVQTQSESSLYPFQDLCEIVAHCTRTYALLHLCCTSDLDAPTP